MVNRMPPVTLLVATPFPRLPPRSLITPQALTAPGQPSSFPFSIKRFANVGCDNFSENLGLPGKFAILGQGRDTRRIWCYREDSRSWVEEETLEGHSNWVRDVAWAPNIGPPHSHIATASQDRTVLIWAKESPTAPWVKTALDPSLATVSPTGASSPPGKLGDVVCPQVLLSLPWFSYQEHRCPTYVRCSLQLSS